VSQPDPRLGRAPTAPRFAATALKVVIVEIVVLAALWVLQVRFTP
jgi:hypothetical protein